MTNSLRILVVEDDPLYSEIINRLLLHDILERIPGSVVTFVKTLEAMEEVLCEIERPDVTILDLAVPPNTMRDTLAQLETIELCTPVVILTGSKEENIRAIIGHRLTPIVEKTAAAADPGILHRAIIFAVEYWQNHRWARVKANIEIMKSICHAPAR